MSECCLLICQSVMKVQHEVVYFVFFMFYLNINVNRKRKETMKGDKLLGLPLQISAQFPDLPPLLEIEKNQSLSLLNTHFSISTTVPLLPSQVEVGAMHCRPAKPLPEVNRMSSYYSSPSPSLSDQHSCRGNVRPASLILPACAASLSHTTIIPTLHFHKVSSTLVLRQLTPHTFRMCSVSLPHCRTWSHGSQARAMRASSTLV